jgi:hypothetical protein
VCDYPKARPLVVYHDGFDDLRAWMEELHIEEDVSDPPGALMPLLESVEMGTLTERIGPDRMEAFVTKLRQEEIELLQGRHLVRHGGHHVAQKLTNTTSPSWSARLTEPPSDLTARKSLAVSGSRGRSRSSAANGSGDSPPAGGTNPNRVPTSNTEATATARQAPPRGRRAQRHRRGSHEVPRMQRRQALRLALGEAEPLEPPSAACRHFRLEGLHFGEALRDGLGRPLAGREQDQRVEHFVIESRGVAQRVVASLDRCRQPTAQARVLRQMRLEMGHAKGDVPRLILPG